MSASFTFTEGLIVLIEGDKKGEWFTAYQWQFREFIKVMGFGTMKSMCYPTPIEHTPEFEKNGMIYRFIIENDWGPCFIENKSTGRIRKIQYFELGENTFDSNKKKSIIKKN
jgi:hypothetical protein